MARNRRENLEKNIQEAQVTILLEVDGEMHLVGMSKEHLDTITLLVKRATSMIVPTGKTQHELNDFLNYKTFSVN